MRAVERGTAEVAVPVAPPELTEPTPLRQPTALGATALLTLSMKDREAPRLPTEAAAEGHAVALPTRRVAQAAVAPAATTNIPLPRSGERPGPLTPVVEAEAQQVDRPPEPLQAQVAQVAAGP